MEVTKDVDYVFNLACNMGGMGFIENNKAECMLSVLTTTNLLRASVANSVKKLFFSSSACVYNATKQIETFVPGLKEQMLIQQNQKMVTVGKSFLARECAGILVKTSG